jgi:hypothetical protein
MNQNDISKRHTNVQNDIHKNTNEIYGLFSNPLEKTLLVSVKKIEKVVAAIYMVTEVMDKALPLTLSLRKESLDLLAHAYSLLTIKDTLSQDSLARMTLQLDQLASLVHIGSLAHHISPMNAEVLSGELSKIISILADEVTKLRTQEQSFIVSRSATTQPILSGEFMRDVVFNEELARHESKRHQNDIKTTLLSQNDIEKDTVKIKTTFQNDIKNNSDKIDRKKEIVSIIKSKGLCTLSDIKASVKEVSDKTLQREVNLLVAMGLIKKEGNKRWTTYRVLGNN